MIKTYFFSFLLVCGLISCHSQDGKTSGKLPGSQTTSGKTVLFEEKTTKDMEIERLPATKDIFEVPGDCAVLLQLTDFESDSISSGQENGENADDINSSTLEITELLEKLGIKTQSISSRYFSYFSAEKSDTIFLDTRKTADYTYGSFILFHKTKQPRVFESTTLHEEIIQNYFNQ